MSALGVRFDNIVVPQGTTIASAYLQFTSTYNSAHVSSSSAAVVIQVRLHSNTHLRMRTQS